VGPHAGAGEESGEDGAVEKTCDELNATPIPHPPVLLGAGGGREIANEVEPGKKGGVGRRCFKIWFYFSLPYSDLIGNKLISLSRVCSAHDVN